MIVKIELRDTSSPSGDPGLDAREALGLPLMLTPQDVAGPVTVSGEIDPAYTTAERFVRERVEEPLDEKNPGLRKRLAITVLVDGIPLRPPTV
jgi:hypothetical protein